MFDELAVGVAIESELESLNSKHQNENVVLNDHEVLLFSTSKNYTKDQLNIDGQIYSVKKELEEVSFMKKFRKDIVISYMLIVDDFGITDYSYQMGYNVDNSDEENIQMVNHLNKQFSQLEIEVYADSISSSRDDFLVLYGGLFFLGIFLGTLFLMAPVLIIYYKQISEGYDDKERFEIMQKVGMSKLEIKKTIKNQVLMVFFLPLLFTMIHIAFAFPIITKLLAMLNLMNVSLFFVSTVVTIIIFAIVYVIIYFLTAMTYDKIVQ